MNTHRGILWNPGNCGLGGKEIADDLARLDATKSTMGSDPTVLPAHRSRKFPEYGRRKRNYQPKGKKTAAS